MSARQFIAAVPLVDDQAVIIGRRAGREVAQLLGASAHDQIRVATLASEAARYVQRQGAPGRLDFWLGTSRRGRRALITEVTWPAAQAPEPADPALPAELEAAIRLMDGHEFAADAAGAPVLRLVKELPAGEAPDAAALQQIAGQLATAGDTSSLQELQRQNRELVLTLAALRERQEELTRLTLELEDTNRGVVALYAEIDAHARQLKRADEAKSRFLSSMSHELRTPLASIQALSTLLLSEADGRLGVEQAKQVKLIHGATIDLIGTVDDLLDLAKIESGKVVMRVAPFAVTDLFSAMRGMLKPLSADASVDLVFGPVPAGLMVTSDEGKVAQILRNFISNALKFTPDGTVTVTAEQDPQGMVRLAVTDTGIGIAPDQVDLIFEEFTQIEHALQRKVKGTGLGLPLCRRLADLLQGRIVVQSTPGRGSVFALTLPVSLDVREAASGADPAA